MHISKGPAIPPFRFRDIVLVRHLELCSVLPLPQGRATQRAPVAALSRYCLYLQWLLWLFLCCTRKGKHLCSYLPPTRSHQEQRGEGQSKVQGRCDISCLCHPFTLSLSSCRGSAVTMRSIPTPRRIAAACALGTALPARP